LACGSRRVDESREEEVGLKLSENFSRPPTMMLNLSGAASFLALTLFVPEGEFLQTFLFAFGDMSGVTIASI